MKFAYLIMAHDNAEQLKRLLRLLDEKENEIYLHIDKKSPLTKNLQEFQVVRNGKLHIYCEYDVAWGSFNQTRCQLFLLEKAIDSKSDYYHLLSGHDLPLKSHKEILKFFEKNNGKEFVHFESKEPIAAGYQPFHNKSCYASGKRKLLLQKLDGIFMKIQTGLGMKRELFKGANWFSITNSLAVELVRNKRKVLSRVKWWHNSDEYVLQTFMAENYGLDNKFGSFNNDYKACCRYIDWNRGKPYVWRNEDFDELINSSYIYGRKFDEKIDNEIIIRICDTFETA